MASVLPCTAVRASFTCRADSEVSAGVPFGTTPALRATPPDSGGVSAAKRPLRDQVPSRARDCSARIRSDVSRIDTQKL